MKPKLIISLIFPCLLSACSNEQLCSTPVQQDNSPHTVIGKTEFPQQDFPTAPNLDKGNTPPPLTQSVQTSQIDDPANYMTIMTQNGAVITPWALAQRNWLWIYPIATTSSFGNIRNWRLEHTNRSEYFRFVNQQLNSCIESYGNGVIHNRCNLNRIGQAFELLPTDSGAVYIKNVSQQRCLTYNTVSNTGYFTLTLANCRNENNPRNSTDQTFYLSPPLLPATTQN